MVTPAKRVLAETTNTRQNIPSSSQTPAAKKIRLNGHGRPNGDENRSFSSQPKSQFEEHLEKLSSSINGLKELNAERDQQWARPALRSFSPATDSLCFQQIDAEEGTVSGGKQTIRLFGVTEVRFLVIMSAADWLDGPFRAAACHRLHALPLHCRPCGLQGV